MMMYEESEVIWIKVIEFLFEGLCVWSVVFLNRGTFRL